MGFRAEHHADVFAALERRPEAVLRALKTPAGKRRDLTRLLADSERAAVKLGTFALSQWWGGRDRVQGSHARSPILPGTDLAADDGAVDLALTVIRGLTIRSVPRSILRRRGGY